MAQITSFPSITNSTAQRIAMLEAAALRKREKMDAASRRAMRRVERETDSDGDAIGLLKRAIARPGAYLEAPAQRREERPVGKEGRSFHGGGEAYGRAKPKARSPQHRLARATGAASSHYAYIDEHGRGDRHASYIDAGRVEVSADGSRMLSSNIEGSYADRLSLFGAAEQFERQSRGDKVTLNFSRMSSELQAVMVHDDCDPAVRAAYQKFLIKPDDKSRKVALDGSWSELKQLIRKHSITLASTGTIKERLEADGIAPSQGRSGRTHFRWVFELPREFGADERAQVLRRMSAYMEQQRFTYVAVIHRPDPHNDPDNHHIHLMFYDRPCRRLTGIRERDLKGVSPKNLRFAEEALASGRVQPGTWDFAQAHFYKTGGAKSADGKVKSGGSWKMNFPFRAEKPRDGLTSHKDYQRRLRVEYAKMINDVAAAAGRGPVYDPRSYEARHLAGFKPGKKLGSKLHAAEVVGLPTRTGLSNEAIQAERARRFIEERHAGEATRLEQLVSLLNEVPDDGSIAARLKKGPMDRIAAARLANEQRRAIELLELEMARERSRATLVRDRQGRASSKGSAWSRKARASLAENAAAYLRTLDEEDADLRLVVSRSKTELEATAIVSDQEIRTLAGALKSTWTRDATAAALASKRLRHGQRPEVDSTRRITAKNEVVVPPATRPPRVVTPPGAAMIGEHPQTDFPVRTGARPIADPVKERMLNMVRFLSDYPEYVRARRGTDEAEPRFELTENAPRATLRQFSELASDRRLHLMLARALPQSSPALGMQPPGSAESASVPVVPPADGVPPSTQRQNADQNGQNEHIGGSTERKPAEGTIEPALDLRDEHVPAGHETMPASEGNAVSLPNSRPMLPNLAVLDAPTVVKVLWMAGDGDGQRSVKLPPEWSSLVEAARTHVGAAAAKRAIGRRPPQQGPSRQQGLAIGPLQQQHLLAAVQQQQRGGMGSS